MMVYGGFFLFWKHADGDARRCDGAGRRAARRDVRRAPASRQSVSRQGAVPLWRCGTTPATGPTAFGSSAATATEARQAHQELGLDLRPARAPLRPRALHRRRGQGDGVPPHAPARPRAVRARPQGAAALRRLRVARRRDRGRHGARLELRRRPPAPRAALARRAGAVSFEEGELRCIMVESQPLGQRDACTTASSTRKPVRSKRGTSTSPRSAPANRGGPRRRESSPWVGRPC